MTPAIYSLKNNFPDAKIYYAYSKWVSPMMDYIPFLDGSILFENVYSKSIFARISGAIKFILRLRKEKFDMVLYGHRTNSLSLILALSGIKYRLGFEGTKYLTHTAKYKEDIQEYSRYQEVLKKNGLKTSTVVPFLNKPEFSKVRQRIGIGTDEKVIGIFPAAGNNPGTQMSIKKWNEENFYELARKINQNYPAIKLIIFEGKAAGEKIELPPNIKAIKHQIENDVISCCDMFISADTGSLHIAAGFDVSTISIFGPTDPRLLAPAESEHSPARHVHLWNNMECSPCYTPATAIDKSNTEYWASDVFKCRLGTNECMRSVSVDDVYKTFEKLHQYFEIPELEYK